MPHVASKRFAAEDNAYEHLLAAEEERYARRGGRLVLVGADNVARQRKPWPRLAAMRDGQPVTVPDWMIPRWARRAPRVENVAVTLHPDGEIVYP